MKYQQLAPIGFLLRLDFRDKFHIEPSDDCKFDYLEVITYKFSLHAISLRIQLQLFLI